MIVLPGPAPPVAAVQAIEVPTESAHAWVTVMAPSPRWAWTLTSVWTLALIPTVSVGELAPYAAPSRAALLTWTYEKNKRPKSTATTTRNRKTGDDQGELDECLARALGRGGWPSSAAARAIALAK